VSLHVLDIPFELQAVSTVRKPDKVRAHNPLVRIPVLVLDDGEALVESYAILDAIDQMTGPERALTPPSGEARRRVMKLTAIALAATEKAQWAFYERRFRPEEKVHQPWIDHNDRQVVAGLQHLDALAERAGASGWLAGTARISQADITASVGYTFASAVRPRLALAGQVPHLARFAARCEALPAFTRAPLPETIA